MFKNTLKYTFVAVFLLFNVSPSYAKGIVVITGGTAGIGLELVRLYEKNGYKVATFSSTEKNVEKLKEEFSGSDSILVERVNAANYSELESFVNHVESKWGKINVVINNAATLGPAETVDGITESDIRTVMELNTMGPMYMTSIVSKQMLEGPNKGVVINVSSGCAIGKAGLSLYSASKAALDSFSKATAQEHPNQIAIFSLNPGHIDTEMQKKARLSDSNKAPVVAELASMYCEGKLQKPTDTANYIYFLSTHPDLFDIHDVVHYSKIIEKMNHASKNPGSSSCSVESKTSPINCSNVQSTKDQIESSK